MSRFLFSPAFKFSQELIEWFEEQIEPHGRGVARVLAAPISNGMRINNLEKSKNVTLEVSGALVQVDYYDVNQIVIESNWRAIDEISTIGEEIVAYFK